MNLLRAVAAFSFNLVQLQLQNQFAKGESAKKFEISQLSSFTVSETVKKTVSLQNALFSVGFQDLTLFCKNRYMEQALTAMMIMPHRSLREQKTPITNQPKKDLEAGFEDGGRDILKNLGVKLKELKRD